MLVITCAYRTVIVGRLCRCFTYAHSFLHPQRLKTSCLKDWAAKVEEVSYLAQGYWISHYRIFGFGMRPSLGLLLIHSFPPVLVHVDNYNSVWHDKREVTCGQHRKTDKVGTPRRQKKTWINYECFKTATCIKIYILFTIILNLVWKILCLVLQGSSWMRLSCCCVLKIKPSSTDFFSYHILFSLSYWICWLCVSPHLIYLLPHLKT